jgi:predicted metal-dependent phosphoesterase TrpH
MKYANCHLHSTYSDAQLTPAQLVLIGKSLGYKAQALTDHETDGGVKE